MIQVERNSNQNQAGQRTSERVERNPLRIPSPLTPHGQSLKPSSSEDHNNDEKFVALPDVLIEESLAPNDMSR